ncbi:hypothetical protein GOODEAATRI_003248 [Goodea atripinnis]|uniref:Mitoguardin 2 n=1 Tax=Goodea atripinnis TaxID=208336 RepID=A0ABV0PAZ6_9TELE
MTVAEIPVFLYSTFGQSIFSQLKLSPSLKKVLFATALGSVALALTAHQLKRRGRKRKQAAQAKEGQRTVGIPEALLKTGRPSSLKRGPITSRQVMSPSSRSNDTMSGISSLAPSKHSSSSHSLASTRVPNSPNQPANPATPWEAEPVVEESGAVEDANAENLYLMGMELFDEALRKWEQALNIRHHGNSTSSNSSLALQGAACRDFPMIEGRNKVFAEKLETLLHRAYHLQEDFGSSIPADSVLADFESEGTLILPHVESFHQLQDEDATTVTSDDSFFSAAEVPDGFIAHFYAISEHVSPVLAFGFLGPRQHLSEVCTIFKVRFTSDQCLAEDILKLSHRRSEILLGYLGIDSLLDINGALLRDTEGFYGTNKLLS